MAKVTIGFALGLILLGAVCFFAAEPEHRSPTAFIPSIDGVFILIGGLLALNPKHRMHAMHVAVLFGMLGLFAAVAGIIARRPHGLAMLDMGGMAVLTGVFSVMCVMSFIQARRNRLAQPGFPVGQSGPDRSS
ncbi:MAG TPA: hypothetical protein VHS31_14920 [Tepidisphaeraceae bacterium]|jgi:hypothetical protein|nr:hypothetical protein [Tepidisphaeraceae bacterium]